MTINSENIKKQYHEFHRKFEKVTEEIHESLSKVAKDFFQKRKFNVYIPLPRLKGPDKVIDKMKRKGIVSNSLFTQEDTKISLVVNDFIGARILCNTKEDVYEIEQLINENNRFKLVKREEVEKQSGYKALHLDLMYSTFFDENPVLFPLELQIKTHLQHAWAEVTHDESYKPEVEGFKNEWETAYSKHMADMLDTLDGMASTIRKQRLAMVNPPPAIPDISESDTIINEKTLSYKINAYKNGERFTNQEMNLVLGRLKDEEFETLDDLSNVLTDKEIPRKINEKKKELRNEDNASVFEILYYGTLLKNGKEEKFNQEMISDYGFVQHSCSVCDRLLTEEEYGYILFETDSDLDVYYCHDHRDDYFPNKCSRCSKNTFGILCKNCEAEIEGF